MGSRANLIEQLRATRTNVRGAAMSEPTLFSRITRSIQLYNLPRLLNDRSLRTKLILAFLAVALLSVGSVALLSNRATQGALTEQVGVNLQSLANSRARAL